MGDIWVGAGLEYGRRGVPIREAFDMARFDTAHSLDAPSILPAGSHYRDEAFGPDPFPMWSMVERDPS